MPAEPCSSKPAARSNLTAHPWRHLFGGAALERSTKAYREVRLQRFPASSPVPVPSLLAMVRPWCERKSSLAGGERELRQLRALSKTMPPCSAALEQLDGSMGEWIVVRTWLTGFARHVFAVGAPCLGRRQRVGGAGATQAGAARGQRPATGCCHKLPPPQSLPVQGR